LLRALSTARTQFIGIEHLTEDQIELIRKALERHAQEEKAALASKKSAAPKRKSGRSAKGEDQASPGGKTREDTVDRLLKRF
jgi:low affinity Fe/Cu permease